MTESVQTYRYVSSSATDIGCVRPLNEDALLERPEIGLWAVADGMGGHESGDFASQTIVETLCRIEPPLDAAGFVRDVQWRIQDAHQILRREAARRGNGKTIGSTLVALLVSGQQSICLWAGDSRLYLLRDGALRQLTKDHSLVQDMVDAGQLEPAQAESHPHANVITRAVGAAEELEIDKWQGGLRPGDCLMLCSDGLTRYVADDEIAGILARTGVAEAAPALVRAALDHQTRDNVSVIVIACEAADPADDDLADTLPRAGRRSEAPAAATAAESPASGGGDVLLDRILAGEPGAPADGAGGDSPDPESPDPESPDLESRDPESLGTEPGGGGGQTAEIEGTSKGWGGFFARFWNSGNTRKS